MEVHNKASLTASRAELGKYSMLIDILKKIHNVVVFDQDIVTIGRLTERNKTARKTLGMLNCKQAMTHNYKINMTIQ